LEWDIGATYLIYNSEASANSSKAFAFENITKKFNMEKLGVENLDKDNFEKIEMKCIPTSDTVWVSLVACWLVLYQSILLITEKLTFKI